jgi:hypothetical protein
MLVLPSTFPIPFDENHMVAGWPELFSHSGASTAGRGPLRQPLPHFESRASAAARESASILRHPDRLPALAFGFADPPPSPSHESQ